MEVPTTPLQLATYVALALLAILWGMVRAQNREQGDAIRALQAQNVEQQKDIERLKERMVSRENAHAEHREAMADRLAAIDAKLDRLLFEKRTTSSATQYSRINPDDPKGNR